MLTARAGFFVFGVCGWHCSGFCLQGAPPLSKKRGPRGLFRCLSLSDALSLAGVGLGVFEGGEGRNMFRTSG